MQKIVFLSHHVYESPRRAGFHELARAFAAVGWTVDFITTGISLFSLLRRDRRIRSLTLGNVFGFAAQPDGLRSHVHLTALHPVKLPLGPGRRIERLIAWAFGRRLGRALTLRLSEADIVVFESNASLLYAEAVKRVAPQAKLVYRVSDDVRVVGMSQPIVDAEARALDLMDLISVPSRHLQRTRFGSCPQARFHRHGVADALFTGTFTDPYANHDRPILTCIGSTLFDVDFVPVAAQVRPECDFHYVGDVAALGSVAAPNVHAHGELPFDMALAHAAYADVGIANYALPENGEYLAETSNKLTQYAFLGRPILAPAELSGILSYTNVFYYTRNDAASIASAIGAALAAGPADVDRSQFPRWSQIRDMIVADLGATRSCNSQT